MEQFNCGYFQTLLDQSGLNKHGQASDSGLGQYKSPSENNHFSKYNVNGEISNGFSQHQPEHQGS